MSGAPYSIPFASLLLGFGPTLIVIFLMHRWSLDAVSALYANGRMLVQLLVIGYVLTYIFETNQPLVIIAVVALMMGASAWIALRPLKQRGMSRYLTARAASLQAVIDQAERGSASAGQLNAAAVVFFHNHPFNEVLFGENLGG